MVFDTIKQIVARDLSISPDIIHIDSSFDSLEATNYSTLEILMDIEDEFDIMVPYDEFEVLRDLVSYVEQSILKERT